MSAGFVSGRNISTVMSASTPGTAATICTNSARHTTRCTARSRSQSLCSGFEAGLGFIRSSTAGERKRSSSALKNAPTVKPPTAAETARATPKTAPEYLSDCR